MRKTLLSLLLVCILCLGAASTLADPISYETTVTGYNGEYAVTITVDGDAITDIKYGENGETPAVGGIALEKMTADMLEKGTVNVDAVSGATVTSLTYRTGLVNLLKENGVAEALYAQVPSSEVKEETLIKTDVLIVGGGVAGLSAAITAKEAGADVYLIEKRDIMGGSSVVSGGIVYAALDEADVPVMVDYYMERSGQTADKDMLTFMAKDSLNTIQWLQDQGVEWARTAASGTAPQERAHFATGSGGGLTLPLVEKAQALGINVLLSTKATELITDEKGAVIGAKAEGKQANITFESKAVILCTGGFDVSEEMKEQYAPIALGDFAVSGSGNVGDGLNMGLALKADTVFKNGVIGYSVVSPSLPALGGVANGAPLYVTEDGSFASLITDYPIIYSNLKATEAEGFYGIFDAAAAEKLAYLQGKSFITSAETVEELAKATGMDAEKLAASIAQNENLKTAPYYAVTVKPSTLGTMGGLKTNFDGQVLSGGEPILGLYAAGEVANGDFFGVEYPASGTSISMCITFGKAAGAHAAALALK